MTPSLTLPLLAGILAIAGTAVAAQQSPEATALEIRHGHMQNYAASLGVIGPMAQGNTPYDAAAAQRAADNLFHLASIDQSHYWLPGTAAGEIEGSRALPAIWENPDDFAAKQQALLTAATALQAAAGTDLAGLQAALGGVGQSCGACHEAYRQSDN